MPAAARPSGRLRRWARRLGLAILVLCAAVTLAAIGFDFATAGDSRASTALYAGPFARVGGVLVAYRRWGASGTPILLIGGAAEPSWVWHEVGPKLAAHNHRVYAIDLPPFGYSERRGPYTMAAWLSLVRCFESRIDIRRPLIVGHSLGAGVAAADALSDPAGVAGIVLLDGDGLPFGHGIGWLSDLLVYPYYPALFRLLSQSDWLVGRVLRNAWGSTRSALNQDLAGEFERPFRVTGTAAAVKELARRGIPGVTLRALRTLRVPASVVWGAEDTVDPLASGRSTAAALNVRLELIPHAGHLSMLANPRAVAFAIERAAAR